MGFALPREVRCATTGTCHLRTCGLRSFTVIVSVGRAGDSQSEPFAPDPPQRWLDLSLPKLGAIAQTSAAPWARRDGLKQVAFAETRHSLPARVDVRQLSDATGRPSRSARRELVGDPGPLDRISRADRDPAPGRRGDRRTASKRAATVYWRRTRPRAYAAHRGRTQAKDVSSRPIGLRAARRQTSVPEPDAALDDGGGDVRRRGHYHKSTRTPQRTGTPARARARRRASGRPRHAAVRVPPTSAPHRRRDAALESSRRCRDHERPAIAELARLESGNAAVLPVL